jgi:hypothetical protein
MPHKITITLLGGQTIDLTEIENQSTLEVGDRVFVRFPNGTAKVQVKAVRNDSSICEVDAHEM